MGRRLALEACDAQGGGGGLRAVRLKGIGNRLVEEEGPARQFAGFGTRGAGPRRAGGGYRTREFSSPPEKSAGSPRWRYGSRRGERAAARQRIRGADERALELTREGAGPRWSRLCPRLGRAPSIVGLRAWSPCWAPILLPVRGPESGRNDVIAAGAEGVGGRATRAH